MSIKTLRKRISLVAVSALGAGLLTVASVAPASAASDVDAGELIVASANTSLGMCANTTASGVDSAVIPLSSTGLILGTSGAITASSTAYAVVTGPGVLSALGSQWDAASQTIASTVATGLFTTVTSAENRITIKPTAVGTIKVTYSRTATSGALDVITITVVEKCANLAFRRH